MKDWVDRIINVSRTHDKWDDLYDPIHFITRNYIERIWLFQKELCFYCDKKMQLDDRRKSDGCTIERLDNTFGHTIKNCVLACHFCNCNKHRIKHKKNKELQETTKMFFRIPKNYKKVQRCFF